MRTPLTLAPKRTRRPAFGSIYTDVFGDASAGAGCRTDKDGLKAREELEAAVSLYLLESETKANRRVNAVGAENETIGKTAGHVGIHGAGIHVETLGETVVSRETN